MSSIPSLGVWCAECACHPRRTTSAVLCTSYGYKNIIIGEAPPYIYSSAVGAVRPHGQQPSSCGYVRPCGKLRNDSKRNGFLHDGLLRRRRLLGFPAPSSMVAPFTGLKSTSAFPVTRKANADLSYLPSNGGRVQCMKVWPIEGKKKFETLSYLPTLVDEALLKQIEYLLRSKWIPCLEFSHEGFVWRENHRSPGYYDGRYWTMWKLPMFGCTDATQVAKELEECKKEYPRAFVRIIGFDNNRQVQCISFIAHKPDDY